tara:strand:+ start:47 stop:304 length:258 start_codon:yes stop_codon:yes gene_type:complete
MDEGKIVISFDTIKGFDTAVDVKKVQIALAVVLEQDAHDQFTLDQALEIIYVRVGAFNINFDTVDMNGQGYDPYDMYNNEDLEGA